LHCCAAVVRPCALHPQKQSDNTETLKTHELTMMYTPAQVAKAQKDLEEVRRKEREYFDDSADKFDALQKTRNRGSKN
jgi:hypothetical protein